MTDRPVIRRIEEATAVATGTAGPLNLALTSLRRYGIGERVVKSALAAGLAWELARLIHTDPLPILAPLTALFTIQLTLAQSVRGSVQRVLGVVLGIAIALASIEILGANGVVLGIIVTIAISIGLRIHLEPGGVEQMTVSALLVFLVGSSGNALSVAGFHFIDTIVGTLVGLTANTLIAPPNYVPNARAALRAAGDELISLLDELARGLRSGIDPDTATACLVRARAVGRDIDATRIALDRAEESLIYNLPGRSQRPTIKRYRRANQSLEYAAVQVRIIARTTTDAVTVASTGGTRPSWLEPDVLGTPLAELFGAVGAGIREFLDLADRPGSFGDGTLLAAELSDRRRDTEAAVNAAFPLLADGGWALLGELVSVCDQMIADLTAAAIEINAENSSSK